VLPRADIILKIFYQASDVVKPSIVYTQEFLSKHLFHAATTMSRHEFARFQVDKIGEIEPKLRSDFLTVNILHLNNKNLPDGEIVSAVAYNSLNVIDSYQRALEHDDFTPITMVNPGTALFTTAIREMDDWLERPIFTQHCTPYDHHWVIGVSYEFPHKKPTYIAFDYIRAIGADYDLGLSEEDVEYLSYPFYLGWLYIYGAIGAEEFRAWLSLCAGMTRARFLVLRALAGEGVFKASKIAEALNLKPKSITRHIEMAHDNLLALGVVDESDGNASRQPDLAYHYHFFRFGKGKIARNLPRKGVLG
jgi:hypothetical protein